MCYGKFYSHLNYGIAFWGGTQGLEVCRKQKRAVRVVAGLGWRDSCRGVFKKLDFLTLPAIYIYECLCFMASHPDYFDLLKPRAEIRYRFRNANINYPIHATTAYESGCLYSAVKFYNCLPRSVKDTFEKPTFKERLRLFLVSVECYNVSEYFEACRE